MESYRRRSLPRKLLAMEVDNSYRTVSLITTSMDVAMIPFRPKDPSDGLPPILSDTFITSPVVQGVGLPNIPIHQCQSKRSISVPITFPNLASDSDEYTQPFCGCAYANRLRKISPTAVLSMWITPMELEVDGKGSIFVNIFNGSPCTRILWKHISATHFFRGS